MVVGLEAAEPQLVTGLNDRLALAVEVDCALPAVSHSELLTGHYHCTSLTLPQKHTAENVQRICYNIRASGEYVRGTGFAITSIDVWNKLSSRAASQMIAILPK